MPNLWKKKNKSYGVSGRESQGSLSAVRPLSAAFGTTELRHLDEDEAVSKKAKYVLIYSGAHIHKRSQA